MTLPPCPTLTVPKPPMPEEPAWTRSHLAVPRADETLLAIPSFAEAAENARASAASLDENDRSIQGRPLSRLRAEARREAVQLARRFTHDILGDSAAHANPEKPLVIPGHQPALYHPGVWAKNFAAGEIARHLEGSVLNLIVDNDIYSRPAIDAPAGTRAAPYRTAIPFDQRQKSRPWEAARVKDPGLFHTFGDRITESMRHWGIEPLIQDHWQLAIRQHESGRTLPECLTALRHGIESSWSHHQLELPMSHLCQSDSFLWVAGYLLAQLPRFVDIYNNVLNEYRSLYRIKSRNHPVPALETRGDWLEAPFWVWRDDAPHRRRVFARTAGKQTFLADDTGETFATLPLNERMDACCAVEVLRTLPSRGIRVRTRALTTTLFARVFLADTFVHGIGGAKYDEMTDRIISRFFGLPAPAYATVSASLYLPFAEPFNVTAEDQRRLVELIRSLDETPERHLIPGQNNDIDQLLAEKTKLINEQHASESQHDLTRRQRRARSETNNRRFHCLRQVTEQLAAFTQDQQHAAQAELKTLRSLQQANELLTNREFSFALYPESKIRDFMEGFNHKAPRARKNILNPRRERH